MMPKQTGFRIVLTILLLSWCAAARVFSAPTRVVYTVSVGDSDRNAPPLKRYFHVTLCAEGVTEKEVSFALPAWSPGWYVLTDAYKNISDVSASDTKGAPHAVTVKDRYTYTVQADGASTILLQYNVRATDTRYGFFAPYLDPEHGFVPGPPTLMYVVAGKNSPCRITYKVPPDWKIASANDPTNEPNTFAAPNYDTLVDQPADLGLFTSYDRTIAGTPFSIVLVGANGDGLQKWVENVFKISAAGIQLFGGAPFHRYIYHFHLAPSDFEIGLEHLNGCIIGLTSESIRTGGGGTEQALVAHEFTHAWNVKRIRPAALGPFDYTQTVAVKDLWWLEGVTDYFAPGIVVKAGLQYPGFWYGYMSENLGELESNPARKRVTLETASNRVWEAGESEGYGGLSYYNKGLLVGLLLDIEMRRRTANRVGLIDMLKDLLSQCQKSGKGYPDGAIEATANRLTGANLSPFFERALRSTDELPYAETLEAAGISLNDRTTVLPYLGIEFDGTKISSVAPESPAAVAGISAGETITDIDGKSVTDFVGSLLPQKQPGDKIRLTFAPGADGKKKEVSITLGSLEKHTYRLTPLPAQKLTPLQRGILNRMTMAPSTTEAVPAPVP